MAVEDPTMKFHRVEYPRFVPEAFRGLLATSQSVHNGKLGGSFVELLFLRVSQINGCAYCMDMHWRDLIEQGIDARRLNALAGWREAPFFTERECGARHTDRRSALDQRAH